MPEIAPGLTRASDARLAAWRRAWRPPTRASIAAWAVEHIDFRGAFARTGRFSLEGSRYLETPLELMSHDGVRMLNILKAPQTAGSLLAEVFLQFVFHERPGPFMMTFQSDDDADEHYSTRIEPTFLATEINREMFRKLHKKRALYRWPHMSLFIQGANMNSLQSKSIRYEWNDEVWRWRPGLLSEAWKRTHAFRRVCKILNISQGGLVGTDWEICWNSARRYVNGVRCEKCRELQPLSFFAHMAEDDGLTAERQRFAGIVWDSVRHSDGRWDISRAAETARFRCRFCGHDHPDEPRTWAAFDRHGAYVCLDPDRPMRDCSVQWNGLVSGEWGRLVSAFLRAREVKRESGNTVPLEQFYQKDLAWFWNPSISDEKIELHTTAGHLKEAPFAPDYQAQKLEWETLRVITADYQQGSGNDTRHLIVVARAWGDLTANRSRLLWEGRCNGFEQLYQLQLALGVEPSCVCVDGSFQMMEVAAQCAKYGWTMLIGDDAEDFLHKRKNGKPRRLPFSERIRVDPGKGKASQGRRFCWAFRWSNPAIKNQTWNLRRGLTRHRWEIPEDVSPSYREGIDSEARRKIVQKRTGAPKWVWVQLLPNNHPWDCECMQTVVAIAAGCLSFDVEEEEAEEPAPSAAAPSTPEPPPHDQPEQLELLAT